ncbi:MAG TPA: glycosyltransferase [Gaiellaceae bacterium]|nr:glycosyltransferase [Gaiellaceae bacterium]
MSRWQALEGRSIELLYRKDVKVTRAPIAGDILRGFGFETRVVVEQDVDLSPDRILFVGGNPLWYRRALSRVEALPQEERPPVIVWHTEPLPMPRAAGLPREPLTLRELAKIVLRDRRINDWWSNGRYLRALPERGIVTVLAVATGAYQAYLAEHGVESEFVPVGYHIDDGRLLGLERDIDVLFLGDYRIRRRRRILADLRREGIDVLVEGSHSPTRGYWGEARTELLNRTKILLNLPRLQGHLPDIRLIVGMANGALVVSEPLHLPAPFVPGAHYVESPAAELPATVRRYLSDDEARERISHAAHELVTQGLTLEESFARLLDLAAVRLGRDGSA